MTVHPLHLLSNLAGLLQGVTARRSGVALGLWGEAGIGKTHAGRALLRGVPCASVTVQATVSATAALLALPRPRHMPEWLRLLLERVQAAPHAPVNAPEVALLELLKANTPFVLLVEDLHEASAEVQALWQRVAAGVSSLRGVGLLVSSRHELPQEFVSVRLEALSQVQSDALLVEQVSAPLPAEALAWIYAHAAGNPLFTLEFLRFLTERGHLWNDSRAWRWRAPGESIPESVPESVEAIVWQGVQHLPDAAQRVLEAQAYLETLAPLGPWPPLQIVLDAKAEDIAEGQAALERTGFLSAKRIHHPLYREVVCAQLDPAQRREMARNLIERGELSPLQQSAFLPDAALEPPQTLAHLLAAAEEAAATGLKVQHGQLLSQAATLAQDSMPERVGELAFQAAQVLKHQADVEAFTRMARLAARHNADPSEALLLLAFYHAREGQQAHMQAVLDEFPVAVRERPDWPDQYIRLLFNASQFGPLLEYWRARPDWVDSCPSATAYYAAYALMDAGEYAGARALAQSVLQRLPPGDAGRADLLDVLSNICFFEGDFTGALNFLNEVIEVFRVTDPTGGYPNGLRNRAVVQLQLGHYHEALTGFDLACGLYQSQGMAVQLAITQVMSADAHLELGHYAHTDELLRGALSVLERAGPQPFLVYGLVTRISLLRTWQPPHGPVLALKLARQALETASRLDTALAKVAAQMGFARALTLAGQHQQAVLEARSGLEMAEALGEAEAHISSLTILAEALEAAGQREDALGHFKQALIQAQNISLVLETQQLVVDVARLEGDTATLERQRAHFEAQGFVRSAAQATDALRSLGQGAQTPDTDNLSTMRLNALGPLLVGETPVRGELRRKLLLLLLEARVSGRSGLSRLHLTDALYPDQDELAAQVSLKAAVFKARTAHGKDIIQTTPDGYALGLGSDAEAFLAGAEATLWRGPYAALPLNLSAEITEALHQALLSRIKDYVTSNPVEAARLCSILCDSDPYLLPAWKYRCQALQTGGKGKAALRLYQQAKTTFMQVGETLPDHWDEVAETA